MFYAAYVHFLVCIIINWIMAWKTGPGLRVHSGTIPQSGCVNEENHKMSRWRQAVLVRNSNPWPFNYDGVQIIAHQLPSGFPTHLSSVLRQECASPAVALGGLVSMHLITKQSGLVTPCDTQIWFKWLSDKWQMWALFLGWQALACSGWFISTFLASGTEDSHWFYSSRNGTYIHTRVCGSVSQTTLGGTLAAKDIKMWRCVDRNGRMWGHDGEEVRIWRYTDMRIWIWVRARVWTLRRGHDDVRMRMEVCEDVRTRGKGRMDKDGRMWG